MKKAKLKAKLEKTERRLAEAQARIRMLCRHYSQPKGNTMITCGGQVVTGNFGSSAGDTKSRKAA